MKPVLASELRALEELEAVELEIIELELELEIIELELELDIADDE